MPKENTHLPGEIELGLLGPPGHLRQELGVEFEGLVALPLSGFICWLEFKQPKLTRDPFEGLGMLLAGISSVALVRLSRFFDFLSPFKFCVFPSGTLEFTICEAGVHGSDLCLAVCSGEVFVLESASGSHDIERNVCMSVHAQLLTESCFKTRAFIFSGERGKASFLSF